MFVRGFRHANVVPPSCGGVTYLFIISILLFVIITFLLTFSQFILLLHSVFGMHCLEKPYCLFPWREEKREQLTLVSGGNEVRL